MQAIILKHLVKRIQQRKRGGWLRAPWIDYLNGTVNFRGNFQKCHKGMHDALSDLILRILCILLQEKGGERGRRESEPGRAPPPCQANARLSPAG